MRTILLLITALAVLPLRAAERTFDFGASPLNQPPEGFRSVVAGQGGPADWKVLLDDAPSALQPLTSRASDTSKRPVVAQVGQVPADERFPMLIFEGDTYGDFKFTTRFKIMGGAVGQMAGIVFRYQDENNYYVLLASALDKRFWFFKVANGQRGRLIGPEFQFTTNTWYEMSVECRGSHIHCSLNGEELIPMMTDNSFAVGKIGFWTKSDSISYFADAKVVYTPREILARKIVQNAAKEFSRVLDIRLFAAQEPGGALIIHGSKEESALGQPGGETEKQVLETGKPAVSKDKDGSVVTLPLRDRNGEPIAAVSVRLRSFIGETHDNAVIRAQPIVRRMQAGVQRHADLFQ